MLKGAQRCSKEVFVCVCVCVESYYKGKDWEHV